MEKWHDRKASVQCLGTFSVKIDGEPVQRWRAGRSRNLFQYLLLNRNKVVLKEILFERLWPNVNWWSRESSSLKVAVHALRRTLGVENDEGPLAITYETHGYMLRIQNNVWIDFVEFEALMERGRIAELRGDDEDAAHEYTLAMDLYRGEFLAGETADWVYEQREWLRTLALRALNFLANNALKRSDWMAVLHHCRAKLRAIGKVVGAG